MKNIPKTPVEAKEVGRTQGWARAAWVYACTKPDTKADAGRKGGSTQENPHASIQFPCSYRDFASLGIHGLTNRDTVSMYREIWAEHGNDKTLKPGDPIPDPLPTATFPPTTVTYGKPHDYDEAYEAEAEAVGVTKDAVRRTAANKKAAAAAVKADPKFKEVVRKAIEESDAEKSKYGKTNTPTYDYVEDDVEDYVGESVKCDDSQAEYLGVMSLLSSIAVHYGEIADVLMGVELTGNQRSELEKRLCGISAKHELLHAKVSAGSMDDELLAMLRAGE
jgi:hypothetical protein